MTNCNADDCNGYVTREGEYAGDDRDPAIYTESDRMPTWAADEPRAYWDAADLYERANGRLSVSADFALPRDRSAEDQIALAREFAQELTKDGSLPYTLAIRAGLDRDGVEHNPHVHLMISERTNDGIDRSPEQWFARASPTNPSKGGAEKTRAIHGHAWMEHARSQWANLTNKTLERLGREERVNHRSYARQGVEEKAGRPSARPPPTRSHAASTTTGSRARPMQTRPRAQDLTTTQRYMHLSPAALEGAISLLERGDILETAEQRSVKSLS